jgi:hypothetical protein
MWDGTESEIVSNERKVLVKKKVDRLCGLVVRVPGCGSDMYCASCEVQTELMFVI